VTQRAFICGLSGLSLSSEERDFLAGARQAGIILFSRNVESPEQVRHLVAEAREAAGDGNRLLVLVDQEGGRVQRLAAPHWPRYPAAHAFAVRHGDNLEQAGHSASLCARLIARDLHLLGINTTCAPVLDLPVPGANNVIGNRAYGSDVRTVIALGGAVAEGLLAGGVLPVIKHIPGHGRAMADSHLALPVVVTPLPELRQTDFAPFRALRHLPMAMTAHVVFSAVDPSAPVTISRTAIEDAVRGDIGFEGLLMSDDLSMRALSGSLESRTRASLNAGCDLALHCSGKMDEMVAVAGASPYLEGAALSRFEAALGHLHEPLPFDHEEAEEIRAELVAATA
jgi:beta-N-acetylhexosaminidase